jgi:adenosyl cobinamide kinase/adenosyl cobinamide phosphate guanylyltransferase
MTVRTLSAGASSAAIAGDVLLDCGVGILAAAAFGGVPLAGVRHLLLSGTGPDRLDPALAAAPPAGLAIHPPGTGPVGIAGGTAAEIAPGAWLLDTDRGLVLHSPDPLPPQALAALAGRALAITAATDADRLTGVVIRPPVCRTLLTGGSRSGKSQLAEELLAAAPEVVYLATGAVPDGSDPEWARRIQAHRDRRPRTWTTVETRDMASILGTSGPPVLLDSLGTWLTGAMDEAGIWEERTGSTEALRTATAALLDTWRRNARDVVAVTEEVGSGIVPATVSGRRFRDELGRLNAAVAATADEVWLVTAGIGQRLR